MRPRQRPAAQLARSAPSARGRISSRRRPTSSCPRAGGRRSRASCRRALVGVVQPRKMSLAACMSRWPSTTRWPWLRVLGCAPRYGSSTDACASLTWRNSGSASSRPSSRSDPAAGADAADADDLAGEVHVADTARADARRSSGSVSGSREAARRLRASSSSARRRRARRRARSGAGRCDDPGSPSTSCVSFAKRLQAVLALAPSPRADLRGRGQPRLRWPSCCVESSLDVEARVPDVEARASPAKRRIASRYARTTVRHGFAPLVPREAALRGRRSRSSRRAASRPTRTGPGSVSSKSFRSKTRARSGDANPPKFDRWASPQSCTDKPGASASQQVVRP